MECTILCSHRYTNTLEYRWRIVVNGMDPCTILAHEKQDTDDQALDQVPRGKEPSDGGREPHTRFLSVGFDCCADIFVLVLYIFGVHWEVTQVRKVAKRKVVPVTRYDCGIKK